MIPFISPEEITFRTARSGGKGGQNVNKVETMVEGYFDIQNSPSLTDAQKALLLEKLQNKLSADGQLLVKSQEERTQLGNKQNVVRKINGLVRQALIPVKKRVATRPSKAVKEKRLEFKRKLSEKKQNRRGYPGE